MIGFIVKKFIGSKNEREVKRLRPMVAQINALETELQKVPDEALREKTATWKEELAKIEDKEELARRVDEMLPEAFSAFLSTADSDAADNSLLSSVTVFVAFLNRLS